MNIAAYLADQLGTKFDLSNIMFDGQSMIEAAQTAPKNTVFVFDEANEGLSNKKRFTRLFQDLGDFFVECGQLGHIFILVLPDFFELPMNIAIDRSQFLLNVFINDVPKMVKLEAGGEPVKVIEFQRGYFEFFGRNTKKRLYFLGKRTGIRTYQNKMAKRDFYGKFSNHYTVDEAAYRLKKKEMLLRFSDRHKIEEGVGRRAMKKDKIMKKLVELYLNATGENKIDLSLKLGFNESYIANYLNETIREEAGNP